MSSLPEAKQCHYHKKRALHFSKGNIKDPENEIKSSKPKKKEKKGPRTINFKVRKHEPRKVLNLGKKQQKDILRYPNA
jgi:hypothetical protein